MHKIVIVDDEVIVSETLALVLRHSGYQVAAFTSPTEALAALREHGANVLITDMLMPKMNGVELAEAALKVCPSCRVLVLSGDSLPESTLMHVQDYSKIEFMVKPLHPERLLAKLQELAHSQMVPVVESGEAHSRYSVTTHRDLSPSAHRSRSA
jgi:DNA-binding NtrC family response regulator